MCELFGMSSNRPATVKFSLMRFAEHGVEAIVYPTVPLPAPPIGQDVTIELNGQQVKAVKFLGAFHWHQHTHEDELFLVHRGEFR